MQANENQPSQARYDLLDGLRGVAALMVLLYHVFNDAKAFFVGPVSEFCHGFLGVDFFFILSGFVMGYAYDDKWGRMSLSDFVKRRLIRLHPMVVIGVLMGVAAFVVQGCTKWDGTQVSVFAVIVTTALSLFLLPTPTNMDVRGFTEAFPLNGPHWSLFFEYIGSALYGMYLHRFSTRSLGWCALLSMLALAGFSLYSPDGGVAYGWSSLPDSVLGGTLRLCCAYTIGLWLSRQFRQRQPKPLSGPVFLLSSLALVVLLGMPSLGGREVESAYQLVCIFCLFPLVIWYAARGCVSGLRQQAVSFLGRLSYPLYAVHYPFVYLYITWVSQDAEPYAHYWQPWDGALVTILVSLLAATLCLLFYDEPLRKWLTRRLR